MRRLILATAFVATVTAATVVGLSEQSPNHHPVPVSRTDTFTPQSLTLAQRDAVQNAGVQAVVIADIIRSIHSTRDVAGPDGVIHRGCVVMLTDDDGDSVLVCADGWSEQS
jgi:hypothetical protein